MGIKPSKTVRCMSHTNTDTVKRQRGSKRGREGGDSASSAGHLLQLLNTFNNLECQPLVIGTLMVKFTIVSYRNSCFPVSNRTSEFTIFTIKCRAGRLCFEFGFKKKNKNPCWCSSRLRSRYTKVSIFFLFHTPTQRESIHRGRKHTDYFNIV